MMRHSQQALARACTMLFGLPAFKIVSEINLFSL
jgi:hypothetical protein